MCDFVQCTLPYIPSLKRERTNSYVCKKWNVTDARFYMIRNGAAKTCKNIHCNGEMSRKNSVNITYFTSSDCQSSHANPFFFKGGGAHRVRPCLDPHLLYVMWTQDLFACVNWKLSLMISPWILIWNDVKGSFYFLEAVAFFYHIKSCQYCWNVIRYPYMYLIQKWLLGNRLGTLSRNDS